MSRHLGFFVSATLTLLAARSHADAGADWGVSFDQGRAASYLAAPSGHAPALLLAGAGRERSPAAALAALRKALASSAKLIMDSRALGALDDLDDATIVKKAAALPVDVIVVVRVFGSDRGRDSAVVTFFAKSGTALSAFSVEAGTPLAARAGDANGSGVSAEAANAISSVLTNRTGAPEDTRTPAQVEYDGKFVGFYDSALPKTSSDLFRSVCPYQGVARVPLCGSNYFEAVDRPDLARSSHRRHSARTALITVGSLLMLAGTITAIVGGVSGVSDPLCSISGCGKSADTHPDYVVLGSGLGVFGLGMAGVIAGAVISPEPSKPTEIYQMAREHNRALRLRVGLTGVADDHIPNP